MPIAQLAAIVRLRGYALQRFFSTFPSGLPGIGLLFLRVATGLPAVAQGVGLIPPGPGWDIPLTVIEAGAGILLLLGFLTPFVSTVLALVNLSVVFSCIAHPADVSSFFHFLLIAAVESGIALLGPGALSIDARLFGRHRIIIPPPR